MVHAKLAGVARFSAAAVFVVVVCRRSRRYCYYSAAVTSSVSICFSLRPLALRTYDIDDTSSVSLQNRGVFSSWKLRYSIDGVKKDCVCVCR